MRRRLTAIVLAALVMVPAVPVLAAAPEKPPAPQLAPNVDPAPTPVATADPTASPTDVAARSEDPAAPPTASRTSAPTDPMGAPPAEATATPAEAPSAPAAPTLAETGGLSATGRYIVVFKSGADTTEIVKRHEHRDGFRADNMFKRAFRGFTARLDASQRAALRNDPNVANVVPDELIQMTAQTVPTGVARIGTRLNPVAKIDGLDERVDADVAIVDTGVGPHTDLNIAGGYNCSSADRNAWADNNGHGTHVAGTVAALDNSYGVVGVAPGARVWAVKILNGDGYGLLSWYVCGLDWILAQRDPNDSNRPLIEAVNMSVAKSGADDGACGTKNADILHAAVCRLVAGGVTVVAAAANDHASATHRVPAAYNEVITVSALADTDGKPGALGGNKCYSWGTYDKDDTFADFSNYGYDVDLIAPGKCIWSTRPNDTYGYSSGTSMAAPAVTGAVALYKSTRPYATPAQVREALMYLGNLNWKTSTDPDIHHEKLLDVSRLGPLGTFTVGNIAPAAVGEAGGSVAVPISIARSPTFFERVAFTIGGVPSGWTAKLDATSLLGWTANGTTLRLTIPKPIRAGTYPITVTGTNQNRTAQTTINVVVENDLPTAHAVAASLGSGMTLGAHSATLGLTWPLATDATSAIAGYEVQLRAAGGDWSASTATKASVRSITRPVAFGVSYDVRVRARDVPGNWSPWVQSTIPFRATVVDDRRTAISYSAGWTKTTSSASMAGTLRRTTRVGAWIAYSFTGRGISVIAPTGPGRGKLAIRIDGVLVKTVSLKAGATHLRRMIFSRTFTASGAHHITLTMVSSGKIQFDGFVVAK